MSSASVTESQVVEVLGSVVEPLLGRSVASLGMLRGVTASAGGGTTLRLQLPAAAFPGKDQLAAAVTQAVASRFPQAAPVTVEWSWEVKGKESGGTLGLRVKNVVAVGSGKGGVGKSTVAASLAVGLQRAGARVGIMDADIYGPSVPHLFGVQGRPRILEEANPQGQTIQRMDPLVSNGVKIMSIGFLVQPDEPVIVRGPILHRTIEQFLRQTAWGELDYLLIDLPPGTGDIALTLSQLLGLAGAVVVCTPQQLALLDAVKAINMFKKVNIPVLGVVENMSGDIFGAGGAERKAAEMGVPFLGTLPMTGRLRELGDAGQIGAAYADDSPARTHLQHVCEQVSMQIARTLLESPQMPTLEIL